MSASDRKEMLPGWELALPPLPQMTSLGVSSVVDRVELLEVEEGDDGTSFDGEYSGEDTSEFNGGRLGISLL